ncbi:restriction endonuclease subunit S [Psychrobacter sp. DAB_AL62B]|uniref:restriction endonuclease subunit S n=1 Tax=Psychrobacter sp. DAB_AL62B TaxID=1028420 RepID=UPI00238108D0|nr:restriction endonuclease subunit S [Psychrobacter sp. DAB_AL62B]MDE4453965.1 restriction endonuclease subunit S [Psychrobacter sp. DAB_AL62B]
MAELVRKYQQYDDYKDSGVEWLGEIPNHWEVVPIKHLAILNPKKSTLSQDLMSDECSFVPMEKLKFNSLVLDKKKVIKDVYDGYTYFENEDILIAKVTPCFENNNTTIAKNLINGVGFGSSEIFVLRVNNKVNNRYLFYRLLETIFISVATASMTGAGGLRRVPAETINTYPIAVPNIDEQTQIANFLDHETAQIDTLIDKQQTLIQLLKEKRQAVISHAVTKGLNPDAPMKDSGVEWLGEVPEHWEISKLKYYSSIQGGYAFSSDSFTEEGVQILKIGNVYQNRLALERQPTFVPEVMLEALPDFIVKDGDILMSLTGTLGKRDYGFAVAIKDDGKYLLNQRVAKLNPADEKIDRDFLLNILWSESYLNQLYSLPSGTKQANLSNSDVLDIVITLPPSKTEQKEIAVELQNQKDIFDKVIQKAMTSIELMQERRTALISAAVTGKIDVRGWVAPTL